jgi:hypothetical protein
MRDQRPCAKSKSSLISRLSLTAALASLTLLLFACPSPISTDLVLSVVGTVPSNGATGFNPGQAIEVTFNKDLDPACLQQLQSPVTISPNTGPSITLTFSYDSASKKLSIEPHPFLASNSSYTVSFQTSLKDASGGTLPKPVDFSFTTGDSLAGDVAIVGGNSYYGKQYTNLDKVTLLLRYNSNASPVHVHIAKSEAALSTTGQFVSQDLTSPTTNLLNWPLDDAVQGPQTFYVQYLYSSQTSAVRSAGIVHDTVNPTIKPPDIPSYYNMYNDPSNPAFVASFVASSSAIDDTSGIATYSWTCAGVTYNAQSPAITISGPDQTYNLSLTVTDYAGNQSVNTFPITKATVPPGQPTESLGSSSYGNKSPMLDQNPTVTWMWQASSNLGLPPDKFLEKLDTEIKWTAVPFSPPSLGPVTLSDGTYKLLVRQVDAAGNQSPTLNMQIVVTPVIPWDGSTTTTDTIYLQWRDFFQGAGDASGAKYRVHFWPHNDPGQMVIYTGPGTMRITGPNAYTLAPGQTYDWYIEWSIDSGASYPTGNRSPTTDQTPPYHQFTAFK